MKNPTISICLMAILAAAAHAGTIFNAQGKIDPKRYALEASSWDAAAVSARLGPDFATLHPKAKDDRPTLFMQKSTPNPKGYPRINPWELGKIPAKDGDYWSESGQVGYVPDAANTDPGLDRIALYAYSSKVFALSPRLDWASGKPHPDPQTRDPHYAGLNGGTPMQPVGMARGSGLTQNEALVIYRDGLLGVAGTQTSRAGHNRPYPGLMFPKNKVPTAIAISTQNEFALVTIWDTKTRRGQLAVVALEGKYLPVHTMPYMGLPNQGSWSDLKLLGYVDLPMAAPSAVSVASNGYWNGPSSTGGKNMGALKLTDNATREMLHAGGIIARGGYAIVASKQENLVAIVDLTRLFEHMRHSYLSSARSFAFRGEAAAVEFHQPTGDVETDPETGRGPVSGRNFHRAKLEEMGQRPGPDACTGVSDAPLGEPPFADKLKIHPATGRRESQGMGQYDVQDLLQSLRIGLNRACCGIHGNMQDDVPAPGLRLQGGHEPAHERQKRDRGGVEFDPISEEVRHLDQLIDHVLLFLGRGINRPEPFAQQGRVGRPGALQESGPQQGGG